MKKIMPYKLYKYITNVVLPKCNMIYGESVSSVYLQLLLNVNRKSDCADWQKNKCWIQPTTMAKRLGYSVRTIYKSINILIELGLIKHSKKEKLNLYEVVEFDFENIDSLHEFNNQLNNILLDNIKDTNITSYVKNMDKYINSQYYWFTNISVLKDQLLHVESLYKGSSLFFIQNFITKGINYKKNLSEKKLAYRCGSSQSTVNRYISIISNDEYLTNEKNIVNKPMEIKLNKINKQKKENYDMEIQELTCPICNKTYLESKSLNLHIGKCKDEKHVLLKNLRKQNPNVSLSDLLINHKEEFDNINIVEEEIKGELEKESKKQKNNINTRELVKYFYSNVGGSCQNWPKECSQIKNLLKSGKSIEDIKMTMDFLAKQGNLDLRFLNRSILDAKLFYSYLEDMNVEGTDAYLVKYFYDKIKLKINEQTLINDVRKIKQTLNTGSSYEEVKLILDYMVNVNCVNINFIGNMKNQALLKTPSLSIKNNPCFYDRSEFDLIKEKLINGNYNINKETNPSKKDKIINIANNILKNNEYYDKYNAFEWAFKIGLELNEETYLLAKSKVKSDYYVDEFLNKKSTSPAQKMQLMEFRNKLNNWIDNYNKMYC